MGDLEMAMAVLSGLGTQSVEDQFKASGLLDELGMVKVGDPYKFNAGRPDLTSMPDGPSSQTSGYTKRAFKGGGSKPNVAGPATRLRNTIGTVGGAAEAAIGLGEVAKARSAAIGKGVKGATKAMGFAPTVAGRNGRIAMQALKHPALQAGLKWAGPVGAALAVGDLVLGQESLANKGMDVAMMTAGGALGSVVPVVGTALGAAGGKMVSDGLQFVFGGGKSPQERKLEEALALLQARGLV